MRTGFLSPEDTSEETEDEHERRDGEVTKGLT